VTPYSFSIGEVLKDFADFQKGCIPQNKWHVGCGIAMQGCGVAKQGCGIGKQGCGVDSRGVAQLIRCVA
jgi:hypothetical protein